MELQDSDDILHDFFPLLRIHKNGKIERYILTSQVPPGLDPITKSNSKDVIISPDNTISTRIFIPEMKAHKKLPLLVHYHGGSFCTGSAFGPITKMSLSNFVNLAQVIAISIEYRLAPEHPLPAAYDDSWLAFQWVANHANGEGSEPWLNDYVDFNQVYIGGESSGADIAHDVTIRATDSKFNGLTIMGLVMVHPIFVGKEPDKLYQYLYPGSSGMDDEPRLNPRLDPRFGKLVCKKVLVCVAGKDNYRERGVAYYESLLRSGWPGKAELLETVDQGHCFHLLNSSGENTAAFLGKLALFINQDCIRDDNK